MVLSKVFNDTIKHLSCSEIVHPGQTCWEAVFWNVNNTLFTCGQLFFPLVFVNVIFFLLKLLTLNSIRFQFLLVT